jgi:hypothetical protein
MLETRMTLYCEIRSVLNPSMPLTTGTFNLLSKTKSGHRLSGPFQSNARNPKVDRVSSKLVSFFSRTLQTYRAVLLTVNPRSAANLFTFQVLRRSSKGRAQRAVCTPLEPTHWPVWPPG